MFDERRSLATTAELADLIAGLRRIPRVSVHGVMAEPSTSAALLVWARQYPSRRWLAGISFVYSVFRGGPRRALVTVWVESDMVTAVRAEDYRHVPRVALTGGPEQWPALPPWYTQELPGDSWRHHHAVRPDPDGRYDVPVVGITRDRPGVPEP